MTSPLRALADARRRRVAAAVAVAVLLLASGSPARAAAPPRVLVLPVVDAEIAALARLPSADWKPGHRGIDVSASPGSDVVAPGSGTVVFSGWIVDRPIVTIDHGGGLVSALEPVEATVTVGTTVTRGEVIGAMADARDHCDPGACVHWGVRLDGVYVDPLDYLGGFGPVVLLPVP